MAEKRADQPAPWVRPGALADYHARVGGPVTSPACRIASEPWQLGHGAWVVKLEGKAGGVAVEALTLAPPATCSCCERGGIYNGFGSGEPVDFTCPKGCTCHD